MSEGSYVVPRTDGSHQSEGWLEPISKLPRSQLSSVRSHQSPPETGENGLSVAKYLLYQVKTVQLFPWTCQHQK